ncbi:Hsp20/alpha crystallin family protein [Desulfobacca acetoxidans]|uniref:Heat shock protein Hsp20 n=1 Tax=Desulfobacca acetoxidans (strain ATCC 700848 / DSM 11109 / ASRB2) TaxID=880072 RepID=F2NGK0_DESAR|nr:Hsp20/alpha crystallin family protein [Desulfobacca acetoxidans]AEB07907.1 heat shock protein Hsp20 [Desulfobacca acetoxidans DSM 11109]HAY23280.1 Hsp20/alpha crystallin family protein [Desulfobacterales bacterium]
MDIMEWKPFREVSKLRREMDRLWDDYFGSGRRAFKPLEAEWVPSVDVSETADKIVVKAEIPGIDAKDIDISLSGDMLTIKGEKKSEREEKEENYHLVERNYGSFSRTMRLPVSVEADKIEAAYKQGVLTVTCPKKEEVKAKAIEIKAE